MTDAKAKDLIKVLKRYGFVDNGGTKHLKMTKLDNGVSRTITVIPSGTIKRNTVERIRKQSGIEKKEFYGAL